jgi:hypothetical protein
MEAGRVVGVPETLGWPITPKRPVFCHESKLPFPLNQRQATEVCTSVITVLLHVLFHCKHNFYSGVGKNTLRDDLFSCCPSGKVSDVNSCLTSLFKVFDLNTVIHPSVSFTDAGWLFLCLSYAVNSTFANAKFCWRRDHNSGGKGDRFRSLQNGRNEEVITSIWDHRQKSVNILYVIYECSSNNDLMMIKIIQFFIYTYSDRHGLYNRVLIPNKERDSSLLHIVQLPVRWVLGVPSPGVKQPGREADYSSPLPHTLTWYGA